MCACVCVEDLVCPENTKNINVVSVTLPFGSVYQREKQPAGCFESRPYKTDCVPVIP